MNKEQGMLEIHPFTSDKPFKLVISEYLERKIRTYCALSPDREWSGVLFYTYEGDFESGVTIFGRDFYLMDQGSGAHTEFDLNKPEITRYMVMEGLINYCMGLCHSHNRMKAFFSGEDTSTLKEYGNAMNNFVSLVVCNDGPYVARVTRKVLIDGKRTINTKGTVTYPLFNSGEKTLNNLDKHEEKDIHEGWIEWVDLEIERPDHEGMVDDFIERFGEIINKQVQKTTATPFKDFEFWGPTRGYEEVFQPSLFDWDTKEASSIFENDEDLNPLLRKEIEKVDWTRYRVKNYIGQLLYGTPFAQDIGIKEKTISEMYRKRFRTAMDFSLWFELWLDFVVADFVGDHTIINNSNYDTEDLVLGKFFIVIKGYQLYYKKEMLEIILQRLL